MTDIFRSEILGVVMNQLVDNPNLPTLFMRTVRSYGVFPFIKECMVLNNYYSR